MLAAFALAAFDEIKAPRENLQYLLLSETGQEYGDGDLESVGCVVHTLYSKANSMCQFPKPYVLALFSINSNRILT